MSFGTGDSRVVSGDGVDDLDRLLSTLSGYPNGRFSIDVGVLDSSFRPCDIEDIQALRTAFVAVYGTVAKPNVYLPKRSEAIPL